MLSVCVCVCKDPLWGQLRIQYLRMLCKLTLMNFGDPPTKPKNIYVGILDRSIKYLVHEERRAHRIIILKLRSISFIHFNRHMVSIHYLSLLYSRSRLNKINNNLSVKTCIALSATDDTIVLTLSIESYVFGICDYLIWKQERMSRVKWLINGIQSKCSIWWKADLSFKHKSICEIWWLSLLLYHLRKIIFIFEEFMLIGSIVGSSATPLPFYTMYEYAIDNVSKSLDKLLVDRKPNDKCDSPSNDLWLHQSQKIYCWHFIQWAFWVNCFKIDVRIYMPPSEIQEFNKFFLFAFLWSYNYLIQFMCVLNF